MKNLIILLLLSTMIPDIAFSQCNPGVLTGGPFSFCIDDGQADLAEVTITGNDGMSQWIIIDAIDNILALPAAPPFSFEGAGAGICKIIHLSYEPGLSGLIVGNNLSDLAGCFEFSNDITVERLAGADCPAVAPIPTMGEWGIIILLQLLLIVSIITLRDFNSKPLSSKELV